MRRAMTVALLLAAAPAAAQPVVSGATPTRASLPAGEGIRITLSGQNLGLLESAVVLRDGRADASVRADLAPTRDPRSRVLTVTLPITARAGTYTVQVVEARTRRAIDTPIALTVPEPVKEEPAEPPPEPPPTEDPPPEDDPFADDPPPDDPPADEPDVWQPREFSAGSLSVMIDALTTAEWTPREFSVGSLSVMIDAVAAGEWIPREFSVGGLSVTIDSIDAP